MSACTLVLPTTACTRGRMVPCAIMKFTSAPTTLLLPETLTVRQPICAPGCHAPSNTMTMPA
ncbi:hypothetical protein PQH03_02320 [Ralstonia insidiosa]|jgi:hypothetical protein|uniref:hypothetical protein n=1 Tax=Ralstonia TaxID=48736 RepID=UPI0010F5994B|nr:hypothetical protein [Ralstonia insidiosa]MBX3771788.1 hypothetical protein [Ralstonia pickettii]NOZ99971.1 hypothetical protein [Betaproteobacteria bacterium]MBC9965750.1 hypothetical protein [Ralstonia insidiosa]MBX3901042.1 hypothetical protein [Ralstonia insidiosa]MCK8649772.1 hypothetical protein [Ralstonia insidiosa]